MSAEIFLNGRVQLCCGDSQHFLRDQPDNRYDSVVTDPPYALVSIVKRFGSEGAASVKVPEGGSGAYARASSGFMGKRWDTGETAFSVEFWSEVLRTLKPGGYVAAFGGTRTYHRLASAIEDAGFEVRDQIGWTFGSGFPKSHNAGNGWGTALKPAWEPICLARKPLSEKTVAANVLQHGTGAINIDGCRVAGENPSISRRSGSTNFLSDRPARETEAEGKMANRSSPEAYAAPRAGELLGRWPANIIHDGSEEVLAAFPETGNNGAHARHNASGGQLRDEGNYRGPKLTSGHDDEGSAARFFYTAKADQDDRLGSKHPTVKPVDLMQWLVRLVTPKGGLVLDPFAGTGTTAEACYREGMRCVMVERESEYQDDIRRRMALVLAGPEERSRESIKAKTKDRPADHGPLFAEASA